MRDGMKSCLGIGSSEDSSIGSNDFKVDPWLISHMTTILEPGEEVLALTDVERLELMAALRNSFDAHASDSNAATD